MYDIVIVGAGPAGATLARLLKKDLKVMIIDKRNLSTDSGFIREKCCGGLLAPAAQKALAKQGLGVPLEILESPQTFSVKSVDVDNGLMKYYQRHYININREKFDRWLVSLIPNSVTKDFNCIYKEYTKNDSSYTISIEKEGESSLIETKVLIGADGAQSRVRMQSFNNKAMPSKYVSIQEHYKTKGNLAYYVSIFDREVTDFYSWLIQKNDELLIGTAIPESSPTDRKFDSLILKLKKSGYIEGRPVKRTGTMIMRPGNLRQLNIRVGNIALAGESAGLISPSSAEGISYALESGRLLSEALNKNYLCFGRKYEKSLSGLKLNLLYKRIKVLLMYNKYTRGLIMKSGILSMKVGRSEND